MEPKNRYYRGSHISERKFRQLVRYFTLDLSATDVAQLTGLTRKTVNTIFLKIRQRIAQAWDKEAAETAPSLDHAVENLANGSARNMEEVGALGDAPVIEHDETFRSFARRRLQKFKGVSGRTLDLHLKETQWRFSKRHLDLYDVLLNLLRKNPL